MKVTAKWLACSLILMGLSAYTHLSADVIDRIVAIVDSEIVTLVEFNKEIEPYKKNIESSVYSTEQREQMLAELNQKVIESLIDQSLTRQEARRYRIEVSEAEIDNAIENIKKVRSFSQESLEKAIRQEGLTFQDYRQTLKKQILQARLINHAIKSKVVITEADIKKQYDDHAEKYQGNNKYHLRNILMKNQAQIDEVKKKLDNKEDFISLAKQYSAAPNAVDGGDLGTFDISSFSDNIKDSMAGLDKGEYTEVIPTAQGFQIFYVADIIEEGHKTFEQVRDEIQETLYREEVERKFDSWLEALKKKAHIKILL